MTRKQIDDIERLNKVIKAQQDEIDMLVIALMPFVEIYLGMIADRCETNELEAVPVEFLRDAFEAVKIDIQ